MEMSKKLLVTCVEGDHGAPVFVLRGGQIVEAEGDLGRPLLDHHSKLMDVLDGDDSRAELVDSPVDRTEANEGQLQPCLASGSL